MSNIKIAIPAFAAVVLLGGTALAQHMPSSQPQTMPQAMPQARGAATPNGAPDDACTEMRQQVLTALAAKTSSPNVTAAKHQIAMGNRACAKGNVQTAQTHYQKALDLLSSG